MLMSRSSWWHDEPMQGLGYPARLSPLSVVESLLSGDVVEGGGEHGGRLGDEGGLRLPEAGVADGHDGPGEGADAAEVPVVGAGVGPRAAVAGAAVDGGGADVLQVGDGDDGADGGERVARVPAGCLDDRGVARLQVDAHARVDEQRAAVGGRHVPARDGLAAARDRERPGLLNTHRLHAVTSEDRPIPAAGPPRPRRDAGAPRDDAREARPISADMPMSAVSASPSAREAGTGRAMPMRISFDHPCDARGTGSVDVPV